MIIHHTYPQQSVQIQIKPAIVSWLADGNGDPVEYRGEKGVFNHDPIFIKTQLLETEDEAWAIYQAVMDQYPQAAFVSIHNERGESLA